MFLKSLIIFFLSSLLISSGSFASDSSHKGHDMKKMKTKEMKAKTKLSEKEKSEVLKLLEENEELHGSFFKYKGEKVAAHSKKMVSLIDKISHKEIKKLLGFGKKQLELLTAKRSQKENNQSYHMFSMAMIHIMNTYELGDKYKGYRCPMVRKQWVQNTEKMDKVHNPYAAYMPHCGEKL